MGLIGDEAIAGANNALSEARARGMDALAADIEHRLNLYKTGQPYREKK